MNHEVSSLDLNAKASLSKDSQIPDGWRVVFESLLQNSQMQMLKEFLRSEIRMGKVVFPPTGKCFTAFDACHPEKVKVVIVGQDPYHGPGQAHGLSFSVPQGIPIPPSLRNIYKELSRDFGVAPPKHGDLSNWAEQGVLLLNSVLTVESGIPNSHAGRGWEVLTDGVMSYLGEKERSPTVFLLWGSFAMKKKPLISASRHLVLEAPHPSPLSAHRGFIGCGHFSKANQFLKLHGREAIDWCGLSQ